MLTLDPKVFSLRRHKIKSHLDEFVLVKSKLSDFGDLKRDESDCYLIIVGLG